MGMLFSASKMLLKPHPYFTFQYAIHPKLTVSALSLSSGRFYLTSEDDCK